VSREPDVRAEVARVVADVAGHGRSLDRALSASLDQCRDPRDRSLLQAMSYGVIRFYPRLERLLDGLLDRPLKPRELSLKCLMMSGLYQISSMKVPDHAAVSATVSAADAIGRPRARPLVNAVLRRYLREKAAMDVAVTGSPEGRWAHPAWMVDRVASAWPDAWESVLEENNREPPMWLRVNKSKTGRDEWLRRHAPEGATAGGYAPESILLDTPCNLESIEGFARGEVSVQDAGAQLAAHLLASMPGERVLDTCAAPGGKTAHILELCPTVEVDALDKDQHRLDLMRSGMHRLGLAPRLICADASCPEDWWDGKPYDRVLVDAPCTASGVIRRHPDIKLLRRESDVPRLAALQGAILDGAWRVLRRGGRLVYSTCSIFPDENAGQIDAFLERAPDACTAVAGGLALPGRDCGAGRQILTGDAGMDGFYYACLTKAP